MSFYLFVPQGCYVEISPDTDEQCIGLITDSMSTCYPVAVAVNGHIFLCHADALTDISDENYGVPAWVSLAASSSRGGIVKIYLGSMYRDAENDYKDAIIASLEWRGLQGRYEIIPPPGFSQIVVSRAGNISEDIQPEQYAQLRRDTYFESLTCFLISKDKSGKTRPPIQIISSAQQPRFHSVQTIIKQNESRFVRALQCGREDMDKENRFFLEAIRYLDEMEKLPPTHAKQLQIIEHKAKAVQIIVAQLTGFLSSPDISKLDMPSIAKKMIQLLDFSSSQPKEEAATSAAAASTSSLPTSESVGREQTKMFITKMFKSQIRRYGAKVSFSGVFGSPCNRHMVSALLSLNEEKFHQMNVNFLLDVIGTYLLELGKIIRTSKKVLLGGLIEHLEIAIISKMLGVNFVLLSPFYDTPLVFYNSADKKQTIYLVYDIYEGKRLYCFIKPTEIKPQKKACASPKLQSEQPSTSTQRCIPIPAAASSTDMPMERYGHFIARLSRYIPEKLSYLPSPVNILLQVLQRHKPELEPTIDPPRDSRTMQAAAPATSSDPHSVSSELKSLGTFPERKPNQGNSHKPDKDEPHSAQQKK